jgi:hypothetical protein
VLRSLGGTALAAVAGCRAPAPDAPAGDARAAASAARAPAKQVLFGDLHVHTTYSYDAFLMSLPLSGGEGAHPPDDACDFARWCADLDFFALTDHAETIDAAAWRESQASVQRCNARANDPANPEVVALLGFEWTQMGTSPDTHWGHRNVIFPGAGPDDWPARPIAAHDRPAHYGQMAASLREVLGQPLPGGRAPYESFAAFLETLSQRRSCATGVDSRALPPDCVESAASPAELEDKLAQWGKSALVIPHGTAWGAYTPDAASLAKHLDPQQYRPESQRLLELYSGHGSSEEYRAGNREVEVGSGGEPVCRAPTPGYLPCCWQAGEIVRERCSDPGSTRCESEVARVRSQIARQWGLGNQAVLPDATAADWLDCGQCRDCFKPAFAQRPQESAQYGLALANFSARDANGRPLRFRFGFAGSSDDHTARPGTGYKQIDRDLMTDAAITPEADEAGAAGASYAELRNRFLAPVDERISSFLFPGGLVAVHSDGRDREALFGALRRREVYATSGPRILLWFDAIEASGARHPMGSELSLRTAPEFEARALGSTEQTPGCSGDAANALGADRLERLCRGECYRPSEQRRRIEAIEIVRIRPQRRPNEPVDALIEDPWRRFECTPDAAGCSVRFSDPDFPAAGRDALYYARAIEEPSASINGDPLGTELGPDGRARRIRACGGDPQNPDCLAPARERAWSSPIFVDFERS